MSPNRTSPQSPTGSACVPQAWFDEKLRDEAASEAACTTLKAYLDQAMPVDEAARLLAAPVSEAATAAQDRTEDELCGLWAILIDLIIEWRAAHPQILRLLSAIARLPPVDRTGKAKLGTFTDDAGVLREERLWGDLPLLWNLLSDYWYSYVAWRNNAVKSPGPTAMEDNNWTCINAFGALALADGGPFASRALLISWGRYALDLAADGGAATAHIDVPAAAPWLELAGPELLRAHRDRSSCWSRALEDVSKAEHLDQRLRDEAAEMVARLRDAGDGAASQPSGP